MPLVLLFLNYIVVLFRTNPLILFSSPFKALSCENGRIYKACGPAYEQSCGTASENEVSSSNCNEGCFCPEGTIQYLGNCIRVDECPCTLRGKTFNTGSEIKKDCNTCKCEKGVWKCSDLTCGARCGAIGDPHYQVRSKNRTRLKINLKMYSMFSIRHLTASTLILWANVRIIY